MPGGSSSSRSKRGRGRECGPIPSRVHPNVGDNSNTQFALLGLYEAERAGVPINDKVWRLALEHWKNSQNVDGSWGYETNFREGTGSMTSAGIASVIIASGELSAGDATVRGDTVSCCGAQQPNKPVDDAMAWLDRNFSVYRNPPNSTAGLFYYLYGLERTGRMTNRRFIGQHDWYREGATHAGRRAAHFGRMARIEKRRIRSLDHDQLRLAVSGQAAGGRWSWPI